MEGSFSVLVWAMYVAIALDIFVQAYTDTVYSTSARFLFWKFPRYKRDACSRILKTKSVARNALASYLHK